MKTSMKNATVALMAMAGVVLTSETCFAQEQWKPRFALQLYSLRDRSFIDAVKTAKKLGFEYVEAYPGQKLGGDLKGTTAVPMSAENREKVAAFLAKEKIKLVSYGVANAKDEAGWRDLFNFARDMKIELIQVEAGKDAKTMDLLNKLAESYKIKVGLHNHTQASGFPDKVAADLKNRPFIGSGADLGHWAAAGVVPLEGVKKLEGRFFTMHMVEMSKIGKGGQIVPFGKGASDLAKVLDELKRQKFNGTITCEYERVTPTLEEDIAECVKWYNAYFAKK
ncbi:MAG TPA: TIM barrel protein [Gemmataceae bacterium]|nr:TIM barrel protein [Gemmataceae bacterium]